MVKVVSREMKTNGKIHREKQVTIKKIIYKPIGIIHTPFKIRKERPINRRLEKLLRVL